MSITHNLILKADWDIILRNFLYFILFCPSEHDGRDVVIVRSNDGNNIYDFSKSNDHDYTRNNSNYRNNVYASRNSHYDYRSNDHDYSSNYTFTN